MAIGPRVAAEVYGLEILATDIADHDDNQTRFVVVAREGVPAPTGNDKTVRTLVVDENYLRESIVEPNKKIVVGYEPRMSADTYLSDRQIDALIAFIRALDKQGETQSEK